jgi:Fur family peroxide stress response transcriptional regulator
MERHANVLKGHDLKVTSPRLEILRHLMECDDHPTADEVYKSLRKRHPSLSKTTVYNTLDTLRENGILTIVTISEKEIRYDSNIAPHLHFLCRKCGIIIEVEGQIPDLSKPLMGKHRAEEFQGYYRGICATCMKKGGDKACK